jgi:hypothetical protein
MTEPWRSDEAVFEVMDGPDGPHVIVDGRLDADSGQELCSRVAAELGADAALEVVVDLSGVARYTTDGLRAVVACARLGDDDRRVRIRLGRAPS